MLSREGGPLVVKPNYGMVRSIHLKYHWQVCIIMSLTVLLLDYLPSLLSFPDFLTKRMHSHL